MQKAVPVLAEKWHVQHAKGQILLGRNPGDYLGGSLSFELLSEKTAPPGSGELCFIRRTL